VIKIIWKVTNYVLQSLILRNANQKNVLKNVRSNVR